MQTQGKGSREPTVYALYFPLINAFKVGFTSIRSTTYICAGRANGRRMFGADGDVAESVWLRPGDVRHEAFIQAVFSFRYPAPREWPAGAGGGRIYEWFSAGNLSGQDIADECESIYLEALTRDQLGISPSAPCKPHRDTLPF